MNELRKVILISGTHCLEPLEAPAEHLLEHYGWNGSVIEFGSKIQYRCQRGRKFADNFTREFLELECGAGYSWLPDVSTRWKGCVESE